MSSGTSARAQWCAPSGISILTRRLYDLIDLMSLALLAVGRSEANQEDQAYDSKAYFLPGHTRYCQAPHNTSRPPRTSSRQARMAAGRRQFHQTIFPRLILYISALLSSTSSLVDYRSLALTRPAASTSQLRHLAASHPRTIISQWAYPSTPLLDSFKVYVAQLNSLRYAGLEYLWG